MHCAGGFLILCRDRLVLSLLMKLPFRRVGESGLGWKAVLTSSARLGQGAALPSFQGFGGFRDPSQQRSSRTTSRPSFHLIDSSARFKRSVFDRHHYDVRRMSGLLIDILYNLDRPQFRAHHLLSSGPNTRIGTLSTSNPESQDKTASSAESHCRYLGRMHAWP